MSSNASAPNHQPGLKPWQRRALDCGRTPLPEKPGIHPWAANSAGTTQDQVSSGNAAPASALSTGDGTSQSASHTTTDHFPDRSLESLKQTYHKRRGAVEAEMDVNV
ncbi:hypothetical protein ACHAPO_006242 [Fusarium lateritium]